MGSQGGVDRQAGKLRAGLEMADQNNLLNY